MIQIGSTHDPDGMKFDLDWINVLSRLDEVLSRRDHFLRILTVFHQKYAGYATKSLKLTAKGVRGISGRFEPKKQSVRIASLVRKKSCDDMIRIQGMRPRQRLVASLRDADDFRARVFFLPSDASLTGCNNS